MSNRSNGTFIIAIGAGVAIGVATGQLAVWTAIGAGLGMVFSQGRLSRCLR